MKIAIGVALMLLCSGILASALIRSLRSGNISPFGFGYFFDANRKGAPVLYWWAILINLLFLIAGLWLTAAIALDWK